MEKEELLKLTEQFIYSKLDSLKIQYFDIYYSKKIQPEIYESTENIIKYINKIVEASKELDNQNNNSNLIKNYENEFGFCFDNNIGNILYYLEQSKIENHKIEIYNEINEKVINNYLNSFNIPKELICFTSYNGSSNNSSNKSDKKNETNFDLNKEQTNKNIINYINGKKFENISIERFNYSLNLEENLIGLTQLPNILLFLLSYNNLIKIDNLMENLKFKNNDNKDIINELKNKLNYPIEYFGYNELDSIFKNDINKKREFRLFNFFKCKKIFEIKKGNKLEKENINSDYIKPYTINFLEIKKSLKYIKENNYIKKFLIKSRRFSQIFEKKKLNIITNPLIYDIDIKDINFPKKMEYELFLIINNNEDEIKNNVDEIIKQIDEFLQDFKDFDFDLHMYYSNLNFHPSELNLINKSRNINYNTLIYQTSKIYHDIQEKIVKLEKSNLNLEKSNLNLEKSNLNLEKKQCYFLILIIILIIINLIMFVIVFKNDSKNKKIDL